jgi:hypothetical protein
MQDPGPLVKILPHVCFWEVQVESLRLMGIVLLPPHPKELMDAMDPYSFQLWESKWRSTLFL